MRTKSRVSVVMAMIGIALSLIAGSAFAGGQAEADGSALTQVAPGYGQGRGAQNLAAGAGGGQGVGRGAGRGQGFAAPTNAGAGIGAGAAQEQPFRAAEMAALAAMPTGELNAREIAEITHMWEEERTARDVYLALGQVYGVPLFNNIARSEQTHMEQIEFLIDRYGLSLPAQAAPSGAATSSALYEQLMERGRISLAEAIGVGIAIEQQNIQDLEQALKLSDNEDVQYVFTALLRGSENHLLAFQRQSQR